MRTRLAVRCLLVLLATAALGGVRPTPASATSLCGLNDPTWFIEFSDGSVSFRNEIFRRPGLILATQGTTIPTQLRAGGAQTVGWENTFASYVGTPAKPADPATLPVAAQTIMQRAQATNMPGCTTPLIAFNELLDPGSNGPWSGAEATYRQNVLTLLTLLATQGAHTFLLIPNTPGVGGTAAQWWQQVSTVSDIVQEVYFKAPTVYAQGALAGRNLRLAFRSALGPYEALGIQPNRLGLMLGFQSGPGQGGREGLQPLAAWLQVVKLQSLAASQVAADTGLTSVWSWGWGTFNASGADKDKPTAACVYLWARNPPLCPDAPNRAGTGFDASRSDGLIQLPPNVVCNYNGGQLTLSDRDAMTPLAGGTIRALTALLERSLLTVAAPRISSDDVRRAERGIVAERFGGDRQAFLDRLASGGLTSEQAFQILGDQLRRRTVAQNLRVPQPTAAQLKGYQRSHGGTLTRKIEVHPAAPWLSGRSKGVAIGGVAPKAIFSAPQGRWITVVTTSGRYRVHVVGKRVPLRRALSTSLRSGLAPLLQKPVRATAFTAWLGQRQTAAISTATCLKDELPVAGDVDLTAGRTYLRVDPVS
jgi:hypothetical protein